MASLGVEAYRVGGSVRDELLGRPAKDADYMVRGVRLFDLGSVLRKALADGGYPKPSVKPLVLRDGRQAGWRVSARGLGCIEITMPRTERSTGPGHRDFEIVIDPDLTLAEDAVRRDFTFNALYLRIGDSDRVVVDPTGRGMYDLQHRLVQTTHPDSFRDDPLRTLRALRFVSTLGYDLGSATRDQMVEHADAVTGLSANGYASGTVLDEMSRILMGSGAVGALRLARDTGVLGVLFPELAPMLGFDQGSRYHDLTTDEHTFKALETAVHVDAPLRVRWALLFHDSGKPDSAWMGDDGRLHYYASPKGIGPNVDHEVVSEELWRAAAVRLGSDKRLREDVAKLIRHHMVPTSRKRVAVRARRMRVQFGDDLLRDLFLHRMCDLTGKGEGKANMTALDAIAMLEAERREAVAAGVPAKPGDLAVGGKDAIDAGLSGRDIGTALHRVLDEVVCQPDERRMSREWQMERLCAF